MPKAIKSPVARHRERLKRQGLVRLEVKVRKEDAPLVLSLASALSDPVRAQETRAALRQRFRPGGFKTLLASAPLEGIDLSRSPDTGRDIDL